MFARIFTEDLGVSTFPIGSLFYLQTDFNARGPESRRDRMLSSGVQEHRLFCIRCMGGIPSQLSPLPLSHCCPVRVSYLRTILDTYAETP